MSNTTLKATHPVKLNHTCVWVWVLLLALAFTPEAIAKSKGPTSLPGWIKSIKRAEERYNEEWAVLAVDLNDGRTFFEWQGDRRLIPASNRKLLTMAMALEILGESYCFETRMGLTEVPEPGLAHYRGDVILRSAGDPSLEARWKKTGKDGVELLAEWVEQLRQLGIAYVHGDVILDAAAFGDEQREFPSAWASRHRYYSYTSIPTAFAIDQNQLRVVARAGAVGGPAQIDVSPFEPGKMLHNETRTLSQGRSGVGIKHDETTGEYTLTGNLVRGKGTQVAIIPLQDPLGYFAAHIDDVFEQNGVGLAGDVKIVSSRAWDEDPREIAYEVGVHRSPELKVLLKTMMRRSDNFLAEQIWRACGARVTGVGTTTNTRRIEKDWYRAIGRSWMEPGWDGSGLSHLTRSTPRELLEVTRRMYHTAARQTVLECLPVSGRNGTLRGRTFEHRAGRVIAKTGTLAGVAALTGLLTDSQGTPRVAFSVLGNAPGDTNGRLNVRINQLVELLLKRIDSGNFDFAAAPSEDEPALAISPPSAAHAPEATVVEDDEDAGTDDVADDLAFTDEDEKAVNEESIESDSNDALDVGDSEDGIIRISPRTVPYKTPARRYKVKF